MPGIEHVNSRDGPHSNGSGSLNGVVGYHTTNDEIPNSRGRYFSRQANALRSLMQKASQDPSEVVMLPCSYDTMTSRLVQQAGFPAVFLSGYPVSASLGLPDTGYIAFQEMAQRIQEVYREVDVPIIVDADTGYGSPMNLKRVVKGFALAGAAGIMIEDQTTPKRCGHASGKSVVAEDEAYARVRAAVDARSEGTDIWILARTDSLYLGYDEALKRARNFIDLGADAVFVEALPDRESMERLARDVNFPCMANMIPGGRSEIISAQDLAKMGYACIAYPFTLLAAQIDASRKALESLKSAFVVGPVPVILDAEEVHAAVGFGKYNLEEEKYSFKERQNGRAGHRWQ